ncbi:MAG: phosphoribosyltransferase [Sphingobacteriaceae bacterium]|nr:MAG: phosphoribosyltransferase [Sphingobacteriaceae bacterium]
MAKSNDEIFSPNTILQISSLFESLNWEIDEQNPIESSVFNRFCDMAAALDTNQQNLIFELTKRFLIIDMNEYMPVMLEVLAKIDESKLKNTVVLGPLVAPADFKKQKSSTALMYYCKTFRVKYNPKFSGRNTVLHSTPDELLEDLKKREDKNISVLLIDDYIGTGQTAIEATDHIIEQTGINRDKIIVLSLACQEFGRNALIDKGIDVISHYALRKGISDFYDEPLVSRYLEIMGEVERKLKVVKNLRFGYGASEALVKMARTPNNTFPIFWLESKKLKRLAPFPRD